MFLLLYRKILIKSVPPRVISTFNIQSRYENETFDFCKLATNEYVIEWEKKGKLVLKWIQDQQNLI